MSKPKDVIPILRPIQTGLSQKTNVPILLPTYWQMQKGKSKHTSVIVDTEENSYSIHLVVTEKPYRINELSIEQTSESSRIGVLSGFVGNAIQSDRPKDFVFYKKKDGAKLWIQPWIRSIIYGERGNWSMRFDGDNGDEPYQQAEELFAAMKKVNWFKKKNIQTGRIDIRGTRSEANTNIEWETKDEFVYQLFYKGHIKTAVKIMDGLKYVER